MRANLTSGIWVFTAKTPLLDNSKIPLIIIADKSTKQTSISYQSHSRKSDTNLGIKLNRAAPKQSDKITGLVVKARDSFQNLQQKEVRSLPLKKESVGGEKHCDPENKLLPEQALKEDLSYKSGKGKDRERAISSNPLLDHRMKPEKEIRSPQNPSDAKECLSSSAEESGSIKREDQPVSDNSGDANFLLNLNPSPAFSYQVPLIPSGHYAEYSEKFTKRETIHFRRKNDSIFEQPIQRMLPQEAGFKSLLKTNAASLIGMIITILLMFMFLTLR